MLVSRLGWGIVLLFLLASGAELLGKLLWFEELGYASVFWRILLTQLILFALATLLVAAYLFANLLVLARQVDLPGMAHAVLYRAHHPPPPAPAISKRGLKTLLAALSLAGALLVGSSTRRIGTVISASLSHRTSARPTLLRSTVS